MKIFGREFKTRKELKATIIKLENELNTMKEVFPFFLGQTVYDVQRRNEKGRYAKKNVSLEHSLINEVAVDEKNYFGLVERYKRNDVFLSYDAADTFLRDICKRN